MADARRHGRLPAATLFAFAVSALGVYSVAEAGHQPLSASQQAQFVSGCEKGPAAPSTANA